MPPIHADVRSLRQKSPATKMSLGAVPNSGQPLDRIAETDLPATSLSLNKRRLPIGKGFASFSLPCGQRCKSMPDSRTERKVYSTPELKRLTAEPARLFLVGRVLKGDRGARDLLTALFPNSCSDQESIPSNNDEEKPEGFLTRKTVRGFQLLLHSLAVLESVRHNFRRFVSG